MDAEHERTRAILWLLAGAKPDMPLAEALGYLKAVEAELALREARDRAEEAKGPARYAGPNGAMTLVKDFAGKAAVQAIARTGNVSGLAKALQKDTGCGVAVAMSAAQSLVNLNEEPPAGMGGMTPF